VENNERAVRSRAAAASEDVTGRSYPSRGPPDEAHLELHDVVADPGEVRDLPEQEPELFEELLEIWRERRQLGARSAPIHLGSSSRTRARRPGAGRLVRLADLFYALPNMRPEPRTHSPKLSRRAGVLLALASLPALLAASFPAPASYEAVAADLTALIEHERAGKGIGAISIALVDGDSVVWSRGFGEARPGQAATADTIYRVGSVSKLFTDIAIVKQVERGTLDLDTPVQEYLPGFAPENPFGGEITLRELMAHRAGLVREPPRGNYFDASSPSLADTVLSLGATRLVYAPGSRTKYSNAGIAVVGRVLEQVTGQPFAATVKRGGPSGSMR